MDAISLGNPYNTDYHRIEDTVCLISKLDMTSTFTARWYKSHGSLEDHGS